MQTVILTKAFKAKAAIPAKTLVAIRNDGSVEPASATNSMMIGVSSDVATEAGKACDVHVLGIVIMRAGGSFGAGDLITSDSQGRGKVTNTQGHRVVGIAVQPSDGADEEVAVLLQPSAL